MDITKKTDNEIEKIKEPCQEEIKNMMDKGYSFYEAREKLREEAYGGKPPYGFGSWGYYWKNYA